MNMYFRGVSWVAIAACAILSQPVVAQTGSGGDVADSGEIVVTAQKRSQGINDVPIAISAVGADQLAASGVTSLDKLSSITPSLTVSETSATGVPVYTIRGIGFSDYSTSSSSTVGLYADEVALPYAVMSRGAFFDVEQVEVLKGPQGDLYGRNTTAGQINVISAKPTDTLKAGASLDVNQFGETNVEAYVSGPLAEGLKGRIAGKLSEGGAWQQSITRPGDKLGDKRVGAVRASLDWAAAPWLDVFVSGHYIKDKSDNLAPTAYDGTVIGQPTTRLPLTQSATLGLPNAAFSIGDNRAADWSTGIYTPKRNNELAGFVARLTADLGAVSLTSVTGYDRFTRTEANDWDGWAGNDSQSINATKLDVFSQELRLASSGKSRFTWIVGGYFSSDVMKEDYRFYMQDSFFANVLGVRSLDTRYRQATTSIAGFAHAEYDLGAGFTVLGGIRYTHERRSWSGCTYDTGDGSLAQLVGGTVGGCGVVNDIVGSPGFGTFSIFSDTIRTNRVMWKAGIDKKIGRNLLYATVSSAFKSGGFSGINTNIQSQLLPYRPETVTAYEVGAKTVWFGSALRVNASAFWYDYKDKQEADYINTFVGALVRLTNVPRSRVRGFEADATLKLFDGLRIDASTTYLDAEVTRWPDAGVYNGTVSIPTNLSGSRLANSPEWTTNAAITYEKPISEKFLASISADVAAKTDYSTRIFALDPSTGVAGYTLVNGRVGLRTQDDAWSFSIWVRNLTDRYYYTSAFVGNGVFVRTNGMPRTFGFSTAYKF